MNNLLFIHTTRAFSARFVAVVTIVSLLLSAFPVAFFVANAQQPEKVGICHATNSHANPYNSQNPNESADVSGHDGHTGPVWFPGIDESWGDIIPPFEYDGGSYPGKNWTEAGRAIFNNNCEVPGITGSVKVTKYNDAGNDGSIDGDSTVSGWEMRLYLVDGGWQLVDTATTDNNGEFWFTDLPPGRYKVCEVLPNTWTQTFVSNGSTNESPNASEEGPKCQTVNIDRDEEINTVNFGNYYEEPDVPVDFCDPSQKPGGIDIAQWHSENQFDGSSCFTYEAVQQCGSLDVQFTTNETGLGFSFNYVVGTEVPANFEDGSSFPVNFTEDENGGSVDVTYYVVGQESDFFTGSDVPNFWDGTGVTVTVDTDCENDEAPRCENLLTNGSFEEPVVTNNSLWQKFAGALTGWLTQKVSDDADTTLEVHRNWSGNDAAHGNQYAELDGDHSTKISQTVSTTPGAVYELKWAFAPRHNITAEQNQLSVLVNGFEEGSNGPETGSAGLEPGDWTLNNYSFEADSDETTITFSDAGPSNSFGTFLDDAQLCLVRDPEPEAPEVCSEAGEVVSYTQGNKNNGNPVDANRSDVAAVENGVADYSNFFGKEPSWSTDDFYSMGINGELVYMFTDKVAVDQPGDDIAIWEITGGNSGQTGEKVDVYLSEDGVNFELAEQLTGDGAVDIADTTLNFVKFVKLVDQSNGVQGGNGDGFDLDAITIIEGSCEDPSQPYTCDAGMLFLDTETDAPETMSLYTVDDTDGTATFWAEYDLDLFPVLAVASDETVYSIDKATGDLVTLDDDSGDYTVVGDTGIKSRKPVAMEFAPDGTLYALTENNDALYSINTGNGVATKLHDLELDVAGGDVVFEGSDIVYVRNQGQVYSIDDSSYDETLEGTLAVGSKRVTSAATQDGTHYAFTRQDSMHPFTLDSFTPGTIITQTGPYAWGDGSFCPAEEEVEEGKVKVFKYVKNQDPEEVPFSDFSFEIGDLGTSSFNDWGFAYDYVPVGEEHEVVETDIPQGYEHVVTVCKVVDVPNKLPVDDVQVFSEVQSLVSLQVQPSIPQELSLYKDAEPLQQWPDNTFELEDEDEMAICLIVNKRDYDVPAPMCSLDIVSNEDTVVVENNDFAVLTYVHNNWTADIDDDSDAEWIWESYSVADPEVDQTLTFKETFEVTGGKNGNLSIAADNSYKAWLNGNLVIDESAEGNNFNFLNQDKDIDVTSFLVDGTNTLLIEVTNNGTDNANYMQNPAGVLYRLTLDGDEESCEVTTDTDDEMYLIDGFKREYEETQSEQSEFQFLSLPYDGLEGWTIELYDGEGLFLDSTTTDETGYYYFNVPEGEYEVKEVMQNGWTQYGVDDGPDYVYPDDGPHTCEFSLPMEDDGYVYNGIAIQIHDEVYNYSDYRCTFLNQRDDDDDGGDDDDGDNRRSYSSGSRPVERAGRVLGESVSQCEFLLDHMQMGTQNNSFEVMKLQMFLKVVMGYNQPVTGFFGATTDANVKLFQSAYSEEILNPWKTRGIVPHTNPTGFVYKLTKWKINDIVCPGWDPYPSFEGENLQTNVDIDVAPIPD